MLAVTKSVGLSGLNGYIVEVEVDISNSLPGFDIVGLPQASVKESKERVRAAIKNSGYEFPIGKITVNLAPADTKKEGPVFDLPIAVGVLAASGQVNSDNYKKYVYLGELSLDGGIKGVAGILPSVMSIKNKYLDGVIVSVMNADEASLAQTISVYTFKNLSQVVDFLEGSKGVTPHNVDITNLLANESVQVCSDMEEVRGQYKVKRALEIAAAGGHNLLMIGPPGSGKTMMARRLSQIMPGMNFHEALEVTKIYSVAGLLNNKKPLVTIRPFRSPHHTLSRSAMVGGGSVPKPGEVSLSHHGILFLDELPEFSRDTLEALRQPLEDGIVSVSRVNGKYDYPANIMLVAAMNPCPCGYLGDSTKECTCTPPQVERYRNKISGPLLDRIDLQVNVPRISYEELSQKSNNNENSADIRKRIEKARITQASRFQGTGLLLNSQMDVKLLRKHCVVDKKATRLLKSAYERLKLTARSYGRVLKVARTIADLERSDDILEKHVAEALQYRIL